MQVISALTDFTPSSIGQFPGIKLPHLNVIARDSPLYNEAMLVLFFCTCKRTDT